MQGRGNGHGPERLSLDSEGEADPLHGRSTLGPLRVGRVSAVFALYLLLTLAVTLPLPMHASTRVAGGPGDPLLNVWLVWWNVQRLPLTPEWWNGPFFHPAPGTLSFSEHLLGLAPITAPVQWLGGSPLLAYNIALLLSFPLCGLAMYLLCLSLTRRRDLALIGGLFYAFAPYRMGQLAHVQMLSSYYMPLGLLGLHGYLRTRRPAWLALFAASWLMQGLCNGYYLVYFSLLVGLWLAWFARDLRTTLRVLASVALAALPLLPLLLQYRAWHAHYGFVRTLAETERFSADVVSWLRAPPLLAHWQSLTVSSPPIWLFPGLTLLVVLALGVVLLWRAGAVDRPRRSWPRLALAAGSALFAAAALSAVVLGPWRLSMGGLSVSVSDSALHKPLGVAWVLLMATALTSPRFLAGLRRRSVTIFYLAAGVLMGVLTLGPTPRFLGLPIWDQAPYSWLMQLPGVTSLRAPSRFAMLAVLCLSVAAVLLLQRVVSSEPRRRRVVIALVAAGILWDVWSLPLPLVGPARIERLESGDLGKASVLELPLGLREDVAAMYRGIQHRLPVVNGYSGHVPSHYHVLGNALARGQPRVLDALRAGSPLVVVIDSERDRWGDLEKLAAGVPESRFLGAEGPRRLYLLPPVSPPPAPPTGRTLSIRSVRTSRRRLIADRLLDGDRRVSWTDGHRQVPGENVVVELETTHRLSGVVMDFGIYFVGYPLHLVVETSLDGQDWRTAWQGETAALALASCVRQPRELTIAIPFAAVPGRFLRLTQTRREPNHGWAMTELTVLGSRR